MNSRERVLTALSHQEPDRVPIHDSPWATTIRRWRQEGMPDDKSPGELFGYEFAGFGCDVSFQFPTETIEDTEEYTVVRNGNGAMVRNWKNRTSTPEMIDFTITSPELWNEHKHRLEWNPSRVDWDNGLARCRAERERGQLVYFSCAVGYDRTQSIVGSERLLMAMVERPEWVKEMFDVSADNAITAAREMMNGGFVFDAVLLFDDMGYRNASLFSPALYRQLLQPAHTRACQFFADHNLPVILHSCGCVKGLVPDLIDSGFACLQPLEVKAGMDLVELKQQFGDRLSFMGGIDVRKMADPDPAVIEEEIRTKLTCAKVNGGYIYHSDHSVPDNVSYQQYQRVIELLRQYGAYD